MYEAKFMAANYFQSVDTAEPLQLNINRRSSQLAVPLPLNSESGLEASVVLFGLLEARGAQVFTDGFAERLGLRVAIVVSDEVLHRPENTVKPSLVTFALHAQPAGGLVYGHIVSTLVEALHGSVPL